MYARGRLRVGTGKVSVYSVRYLRLLIYMYEVVYDIIHGIRTNYMEGRDEREQECIRHIRAGAGAPGVE